MKMEKARKGISSWKKRVVFGFMLVALLCAMIAAPLMAYQVTRGDTLWDISGKFLKNPFLWPKVWALNPYIPNPHWIYPGNKIKLKAPQPPLPPQKAPKVVQKQAPPKSAPEPAILTHPNIEAEGFIAKSKLKEVGRVLTNEDDTPMDSEPKVLCFYTKRGEVVHPGDRFTTFTYVKTVYHPHNSGEKIGYLVELGGEIEVYRVEGRFCFAKILHSYMEIDEGDPIGRFKRWPSKLVITPVKKPLEAYVVMMKEGLMMGAQDKVLYIDKGSNDGLKPGNTLSIYHECPPKQNPYHPSTLSCRLMTLPDYKIGTLVVLSTQPHTATAMVLQNDREIIVGDRVSP
jgi:hypothetical protein